MKKLLLIVWCLIVANQGLVGMDEHKKNMEKKYQEEQSNDSEKEDNELENGGSHKKESRKIGTGTRPARISDFSDVDEDEKKRALTHHNAGEEFKKKLAEKNGFNNSNDYLAYENYEQQKFFKKHNDTFAIKNGFKNYNQFLGKEHAEQQFYAQQELKKIKKENRTIGTIATDLQDAFWDKTIDLTAGAGAEIVVGTFIVPHLQDAARSLRAIIFPKRVKQEQEQQLIEEFMQQEASALNAKEKEAHTRSYVNNRFLQIYNTNTLLLEQKGLDKDKQKALKKELDLINQEFNIMLNPNMFENQEVAQKFKDKLESLYKKYNISYDGLALIEQQNQLEQNILINTKSEIEALRQLVDFAEQSSDRKSTQFMDTVFALQELAKK